MPLACFFYSIISEHYLLFNTFANGKETQAGRKREKRNRKKEKGEERRKLWRSGRGGLIEVEEGNVGTFHREGDSEKEQERRS